MKIVFLDIDGILHTRDSMDEQPTFSEEAVRNFLHILKVTGAKIVISSSWRIMVREDLDAALSENGIDPALVVGLTPMVGYSGQGEDLTRREEILQYVQEHAGEIDAWIALDDDSSILDLPRNNYVYVEDGWDKGGLQAKHAQEAIWKLTLPVP